MSDVKTADSRNFVVGAVIVNRSLDSPKFLILRRKEDDFMGGIDELPSGKVEGDEGLIQALEREVEEETGLLIDEVLGYWGSFEYIVKDGQKQRQFNFAVAAKMSDVEISPDEHSGFEWIALNEMDNTKLTDNIKNIITLNGEILRQGDL